MHPVLLLLLLVVLAIPFGCKVGCDVWEEIKKAANDGQDRQR